MNSSTGCTDMEQIHIVHSSVVRYLKLERW